jgi:hypothetical protein
MTKLSTSIPFSGFYNSFHDAELDSALEQTFSDNIGEPRDALVQKAFDLVDWRKAHTEYAKQYAECFAIEYGLKTLKFEELSSPREYNFTTDRIFCEIALSEVKAIFKAVDKEALKQALKDNFTSYDGFISYYSNDLEDWPEDLEEWDHNQVGILIGLHVRSKTPEFDPYAELQVFDHPYEVAYQIISECLEGKEAERLFKIADYLNTREHRGE